MALTRAEIKRRYRERHQERIAAYAKAYYWAHKDEIAARVKQKRRSSPEVTRGRWGKWYEGNRDRKAVYNREYFRKRKAADPALHLFKTAKARVNSHGREFTISVSDVVIPDVCPLLGIPLDINSEDIDFRPSLDRIDTDKGYIHGNVQVISYRANRLKSDSCGAELLMLAVNVLKAEGEISGN